MKKLYTALSVLLMCYSCGNPFLNNVYSGIDSYKPPSSEQLSTLTSVLKEIIDANFRDHLSKDSDLSDHITRILQSEVNEIKDKIDSSEIDSITDEEKQSLIAMTEVELATSNTDDSLNSLDDLISDAVTNPGNPILEKSTDIMRKIVNIDPNWTEAEKRESIAKQIDALLVGAKNFALYQTINTDADGNYNPPVDPLFSEAETAGKALYSGVTAYVVRNIEENTIPAEIKNDPANAGASIDELRKIALIDAMAKGQLLPSYTFPAGYDVGSPYTDIAQAMMKDQGVDKVVNHGLTLADTLNKILG